jgi:hypothetical protein
MPGATFGAEPAAPVAGGGETAAMPAAPVRGVFVMGRVAVVPPLFVAAARPAVLIDAGAPASAGEADSALRPAAPAPLTPAKPGLAASAPADGVTIGLPRVSIGEALGEQAAAIKNRIDSDSEHANAAR